jgi:hypothetical protein
MATLPTKEENAQKVLEVFSHFRARPGHVLRANNFVTIGARRRWEMSDLQQGLEFAYSLGWIREKSNGIELTQEGFAEMPQNFVTG